MGTGTWGIAAVIPKYLSLRPQPLLLPILHNPVSCGADGLLGDAHDAAYGLIVHVHFVEDEARGVVGGLLIIRKSRGARCNICVELCTFVDEGIDKSTFLCPFLKKVWSRGYLLRPLSCL